jgi:hypothetical protein
MTANVTRARNTLHTSRPPFAALAIRCRIVGQPSYNLYHPYIQLLRGTVTRFQNSNHMSDEKTCKSVKLS